MLPCGFFFAGIFLGYPVTGSSITLTWDDAGPDVAGYRLYYGIESGIYPFVIDVGPATSCLPPPNLVFGTTYFFAVKAYNHQGVESDFGSETVYTPRLGITFMYTDGQGTVLGWASEPGSLYRVLATETLTDPVWADVSGPLFAPSNTRLWLHMKPPVGRPSIFYRIETLSDFR